MRHLPPVLVILALAGCGPQAPDGSTAAPPADAPPPAAGPTEAQAEATVITPAKATPAPFAGDLNALGTEPFWSVQIRGDQVKLSRPDHEDVMAPNPGPEVKGGQAVWTAIRPEGPMTITLTKGDCSDGMSDRQYPMTAQVEFAGQALKGCAASAAALAAAPRP